MFYLAEYYIMYVYYLILRFKSNIRQLFALYSQSRFIRKFDPC